jgi:hypothetical protein
MKRILLYVFSRHLLKLPSAQVLSSLFCFITHSLDSFKHIIQSSNPIPTRKVHIYFRLHLYQPAPIHLIPPPTTTTTATTSFNHHLPKTNQPSFNMSQFNSAASFSMSKIPAHSILRLSCDCHHFEFLRTLTNCSPTAAPVAMIFQSHPKDNGMGFPTLTQKKSC